jgi:hypothetical protein
VVAYILIVRKLCADTLIIERFGRVWNPDGGGAGKEGFMEDVVARWRYEQIEDIEISSQMVGYDVLANIPST